MKRRRGIYSDWILALKDSRKTRRLRSQSASFTNAESVPIRPLDEDIDEDMERSYVMTERDEGYFQPFDEEYPALDNDSHREQSSDQDSSDEDSQVESQDDDSQHESGVGSRSDFHRSNESRLNRDGPPCAGDERSSSPDVEFSEHSLSQHLPQQETALNSAEPDLVFLLRMRRKWESSFMLTAMIAVVGSLRYSVQDYEFCRDIVTEHVPGAGREWPTYSRVHKNFTEVIQHCLPANHLIELPHKATHNERSAGNTSSQSQSAADTVTKSGTVRVFMPSSWAKLDVATSIVYDDMYPEQTFDTNNRNRLDGSCAVQQREKFTSACDHIMLPFRGENVACGPGSSVEICIKGGSFEFDTPYEFSGNDESTIFLCLTAATWCVGGGGRPNRSYTRAKQMSSISLYQQSILRVLSTSENPCDAPNASELLHCVLPGDICTLLSSECTGLSNVFDAVLVNRFWRFEDGTPSSFILWVRVCDDTGNEHPSLDVADSSLVLKISLSTLSGNETTPNHERFRSQGILSNGTPFVVYRILLYCDDFQKSSSPYSKGSAGGCYFLPMSLPPEARRSTSAVRIISLTPPGISTNEVLRYITDDLVSATVYGVDGTNPKHEKVKIFIDVMGFIGDYPAAAAVVDVMGHVSRAPCNICSFRRLHANEADGSRYGYTTTVHAGNSTFLRHGERHLSLRRSEISDTDAARLGMINSDRARNRTCPLIYFSEQLEAVRSNIPLTSTGLPVVSGLFDPYRSNVIAPDHLLTGLSKDVLNTVFCSLPSEEMRLKADLYICAALRDNGLLKQGEVFNKGKKALHGMTLSEIYCVMVVAEPTMKTLTASLSSEHVSKHASSLLFKLQALIAITYWWPQRNVDGNDALRRLMLGEKADALDDSTDGDFIRQSDEIIQKLFSRAVCRRFQKDNRISNFATTKHSAWTARGKMATLDLSRDLGMSYETTKKNHWYGS